MVQEMELNATWNLLPTYITKFKGPTFICQRCCRPLLDSQWLPKSSPYFQLWILWWYPTWPEFLLLVQESNSHLLLGFSRLSTDFSSSFQGVSRCLLEVVDSALSCIQVFFMDKSMICLVPATKCDFVSRLAIWLYCLWFTLIFSCMCVQLLLKGLPCFGFRVLPTHCSCAF